MYHNVQETYICNDLFYIGWGNDVTIYNHKYLLNYIHNRSPETPLLTICNHTSTLDDPFLMGNYIYFYVRSTK